MKGITPVIATILLLFITITMVGFAFVWFSRIGDIVANETTSSTQEMLRQQGTKALIDTIDRTGNRIYIKNTGSWPIKTSEMNVYLNGVTLTSCSGIASEIAPGATATCNVVASIFSCSSMKITTIGTGDTRPC